MMPCSNTDVQIQKENKCLFSDDKMFPKKEIGITSSYTIFVGLYKTVEIKHICK